MRRLLLVACAAALAAPATARADATIVLTSAGPIPPTVTVRAGEAVHWTNEHFLTQTVTAADGLFDSGPVPAGGGFSLSLHVPGEHAYASAENPFVTGTVRVIGRRLGGADADPARDAIPRIRFPEADPAEVAQHPLLTLSASTTRILAGVAESATVGDVNAALAAADAEIVGGLPALGMLLLSVPEETGPLGRFTALDEALRSLRASGAFSFASMSTVMTPDAVPRRAESLVEDKAGNWGWDAEGIANWGLRNARFPQAWNLRESIGARGPQSVLTGVLDAGFEEHPDLGMQVLENLCPPGEPCVSRPARADSHGNHVSGIIGARWDNPAPGEPGRSAGVSGGNPFARMVGAVPGRVDRAELFDEFVEGFYAFVAARPPGLRVINYSMGVGFDAEQWVTAHKFPTCGPGATDDDLATYVAAAKEWCTPNNDDEWLRERAHAGMA
jgi:plastocyanin